MMEIKKTNEWFEIKEKSELKGFNGGFIPFEIIKRIFVEQQR